MAVLQNDLLYKGPLIILTLMISGNGKICLDKWSQYENTKLYADVTML